jgi:hypothetical protein
MVTHFRNAGHHLTCSQVCWAQSKCMLAVCVPSDRSNLIARSTTSPHRHTCHSSIATAASTGHSSQAGPPRHGPGCCRNARNDLVSVHGSATHCRAGSDGSETSSNKAQKSSSLDDAHKESHRLSGTPSPSPSNRHDPYEDSNAAMSAIKSSLSWLELASALSLHADMPWFGPVHASAAITHMAQLTQKQPPPRQVAQVRVSIGAPQGV